MNNRLNGRAWLGIVIFSLVGQIAWTMENMFYNLYIVDQFNATSNAIALMVSLSAVTVSVINLRLLSLVPALL